MPWVPARTVSAAVLPAPRIYDLGVRLKLSYGNEAAGGPRFPLTSKLLPPASRDLRCFSWCAVPSLPQIGKECLKCYQTHPYEALNNERLPTGVRRMATGLGMAGAYKPGLGSSGFTP